MRAADTSEKAAAIQDELHRALGPAGRFELALRMSDLAREFAIAGVRQKHPGLNERELLRELVRTLYGK